uniref:Uncharacterized protein n=1 Tax=Lepeophtheirus salmonis TaxID=72036 RepID=A0A0K2UM93_LEPSM
MLKRRASVLSRILPYKEIISHPGNEEGISLERNLTL